MHTLLRGSLTRVHDAVRWRVRRLFGDDLVDRAIVRLAPLWRPFLKGLSFIGVAGSAGKTTTKELLLVLLSQTGRGLGTVASLNNIDATAQALMRARPTDQFFVAELSEDAPGVMDAQLALLRPSIGILTVVGDDHLAAFGSRERLAQEMSKLVACLPANGVAVLNADDEIVMAMAAQCKATVLTYGISPNAELRAEEVGAVWPDRLKMRLVWRDERVQLQTQLCGQHWASAVLATIGGGLAMGRSLAECAEAVAGTVPFEGRMQPVKTPDGVTFIRDDWKAPLWTVGACFDFMKAARAKRKIIVIGELSDVGSQKGVKYKRTAISAQEIADIVIFVGLWASSVLHGRKPGNESTLLAFTHLRDAAEYLKSTTRDGDLVLLKGTNSQDHFIRIIMARTNDVVCWRGDCQRHSFCNVCAYRTKPSGAPISLPVSAASELMPARAVPRGHGAIAEELFIVGLGNPEAQYAETPHSIGYAVVDRLAATLGLGWTATAGAWIARGTADERAVCLIKVNSPMNLIGACLKRLSQSLEFNVEQCLLVHDDLAIPLGAVRIRRSGGAGGHRGVASILEAFQTDTCPRLKVGVGQGQEKLNHAEYVLTSFDAETRPVADLTIALAVARVREAFLSSAAPMQKPVSIPCVSTPD